MKNVHSLYYRPEGAWVGDCMPCYHDGLFYIYYQCDKRIPKPFPDGEDFGWSLATTKDMVNYTDYGVVLEKGAKDTHEECLYAGSVIWGLGCFHAFYTGECRSFKKDESGIPGEIIMHATSDDGITWKKHPSFSMMAPEGYEKAFFRDPHIFFDDDTKKWTMVVPVRRNFGPAVRKGVMIHFTSDDLFHWTFAGELWAPNMYHLLQMPDLFRIGDWWYMFFSEYCDERKTRYRMSKSIHGPWIAPYDDCLDGRCYYAARTIKVGDKRYLYGWNPTRVDNDDKQTWIWGGSEEMHEVFQREDGTLGVKLPDLFDARFQESEVRIDDFTIGRVDGSTDRVLVKDSGTFFRLDMDFQVEENTHSFLLKLYEDTDLDKGYSYTFQPSRKRVGFDIQPNMKWFLLENRGLSRPVDLGPGKMHHLTIIVDDDMSVLYVDDVALSSRMCNKFGTELKLTVNAGQLKVQNVKFFNGIIK